MLFQKPSFPRSESLFFFAFAFVFAVTFVFALLACQPTTTPEPHDAQEAQTPDNIADSSSDKTCSGSLSFCGLRFDQMIFPMAHNAMSNAEEKWELPLQNWSMTRQMQNGVRGLMLDTYEKDGKLVLCHGFCQLGQKSLKDGLLEIKQFLDDNPREIITIEFQDDAPPDKTVQVFREIGLDALAHTQPKQAAWPTLLSMLQNNKRLVVLADTHGGKVSDAPWYHKTWELAWDNPYAAKKIEDFDCSVGRGQASNRLFILNHFLTAPLGLPELAKQANTQASLNDHIQRCQKEHNRLPNFVAVDFVDIGAVFDVVFALRTALAP